MARRIIIIGGGFNGQLLHTLFPEARVFDWRPAPPDPSRQPRQFGPQYLWEPIPGLAHRAFNVYTTVDGDAPNDQSILAYKRKVGKEQDDGDWRAQFWPVMPGYDVTLPPSRVEYDRRIVNIDRMRNRLSMADGSIERYDVLISTIPLYALLSLAGIPEPHSKLLFRPIYVTTAGFLPRGVHGDMLVDYVSAPHTPVYRTTERDGQRHLESLEPMGFPTAIKLVPGKIYPNSYVRDMLEQLFQYGIATFGRYASWHPDELAHETYRRAQLWRETWL
jgi:hypothetical protein